MSIMSRRKAYKVYKVKIVTGALNQLQEGLEPIGDAQLSVAETINHRDGKVVLGYTAVYFDGDIKKGDFIEYENQKLRVAAVIGRAMYLEKRDCEC